MTIREHYAKRTDPPQSPAGNRRLAGYRVNIYSDIGDAVHEGDVVTLSAELLGVDASDIALQWQVAYGGVWVDVPGATRLTHSFIATQDTIDRSWRLSVAARPGGRAAQQ